MRYSEGWKLTFGTEAVVGNLDVILDGVADGGAVNSAADALDDGPKLHAPAPAVTSDALLAHGDGAVSGA